jgi:hypothetical protein
MHHARCQIPLCKMPRFQIPICPMSLYQIPLCPPLMPNVNIPNVIHHANMANFILTNVALPTVILLHVTRLHVVAPIASYDESRSSGIDKNVAPVCFFAESSLAKVRRFVSRMRKAKRFQTLAKTCCFDAACRYLRNLCGAKDFGHDRDKMVRNVLKNESFCYKNICLILTDLVHVSTFPHFGLTRLLYECPKF